MDNQINVEDFANRRDLYIKSHIKHGEVCLKMLNKSLSYYLKLKDKQEATWQMVQSDLIARTPSQRIKFSVLCEEVGFYREVLDFLFDLVSSSYKHSGVFDKYNTEVKVGDRVKISLPYTSREGVVVFEKGCFKHATDNDISICLGSFKEEGINIINE